MAVEEGFNVGDMEQVIHVNLRLLDQSETPAVAVSIREDPLDRVRRLDISVDPPFPEKLWLEISVQIRELFKETPIVLRGKLLADEKREIGTIAVVLTGERRGDYVLEPVNVLGGLDDLPDSMLITLDLEGLLMPAGTDPATIDPTTATTDPDRMSHAMTSTVVRLEFRKGNATETPAGAQPEPEGSAAPGTEPASSEESAATGQPDEGSAGVDSETPAAPDTQTPEQ